MGGGEPKADAESLAGHAAQGSGELRRDKLTDAGESRYLLGASLGLQEPGRGKSSRARHGWRSNACSGCSPLSSCSVQHLATGTSVLVQSFSPLPFPGTSGCLLLI